MITYGVGGKGSYPLVYGATLGQQHREPLLELLIRKSKMVGKYDVMPTETVVVSFRGIELASASYLKALVLPLLGDLSTIEGYGELFRAGTFVFPFVGDLTDEVRHELAVLLKQQGIVYLEAVNANCSEVSRARLLGDLDTPLLKTLRYVTEGRESTATSLHAKYPSEGISITGWNNRLADLFSARLIDRRKEGRQWIYTPLVQEVIYG